MQSILVTPDVVARLQPQLLHRVILHSVLESCGELIALATPAQLKGVFDIDLWRPPGIGTDEHFDAERFGAWLEVLLDTGPEVASRTLAGMEPALLVTALAQHVRVFHAGSMRAAMAADDDAGSAAPRADGGEFKVGGYLVEGRGTGAWEPIVGVLLALEAEQPACFDRIMRGCLPLSNAGFELDGLNNLLSDREQALFDLHVDRERRRDAEGFASPAQARAFLDAARHLDRGAAAGPDADPIALAYLQAADGAARADDAGGGATTSASAEPSAAEGDVATRQLAAVIDMMREAHLVPEAPRALLHGATAGAPALAHLGALMESAREQDPARHAALGHELAFLANTLIAGCPLQDRAFTAQEASDAAAATCNLGLAHWPAQWGGPGAQSLVDAFKVGWSVLYSDVAMYAAGRLIRVLAGLHCSSREVQHDLVGLRRHLKTQWLAGTPWSARSSLDVITALDLPAWAALLGLIAECPVLHAAVVGVQRRGTHTISATDFAFIADDSQCASVRAFMDALPDMLVG